MGYNYTNKKDGKDLILVTVESELGPARIYDSDGTLITALGINKEAQVKILNKDYKYNSK